MAPTAGAVQLRMATPKPDRQRGLTDSGDPVDDPETRE